MTTHSKSFPDSETSSAGRQAPGRLLEELEARQDQALAELEALDAKLIEVLIGLGATPEQDESIKRVESGDVAEQGAATERRSAA